MMTSRVQTHSEDTVCQFSAKSQDVARDNDDTDLFVKTSPTRIVDFSAVQDQEEDEVEDDEKSKLEAKQRQRSIFRRLASPNFASSPHRKSHRGVRVLPTLQEKSTETSDGEDESSSSTYSSLALEDDLSSPHLSLPHLPLYSPSPKMTDVSQKKSPNKKKQNTASNRKCHLDRVNELRDKAADMVKIGCEREALKVYDQAVRMNIAEIERIKNLIEKADKKHPSTVDSIHTRLREDWLKVGLSIGELRTSMAVLFERIGNYKLAISCCKEAHYTYQHHATLLQTTQDGANASELAKKAQGLLEQMKLAQSTFSKRIARHKDLVVMRGKIASTGDKTLLKMAEAMAIAVKSIEASSLGAHHPQVADTCTILAELMLEQDDFDRAIAYAKKAAYINETSLGDKHPKTGRSMVHLARLYASASDEDAAVEQYSRSLDILRSSVHPDWIMISVLNEVAFIHMSKHQLDEAVQYLQEAFELFKSSKFGSNPKELGMERTCEMIFVLRNLGHCYYDLKKYSDSAGAFVNALEMQRDFRRVQVAAYKNVAPEDRAPLPFLAHSEGIAETLRRLGKAYDGAGMYQEATVVLKEAVVVYRIAVASTLARAKGKVNASLPVKEDELASALFCLGEVRFDAGAYDQASKIFEESLEIRLFSDAHSQGNRKNMVHCSMCLAGIGNCHFEKGELKVALTVYRDALNFCVAHGKLF